MYCTNCRYLHNPCLKGVIVLLSMIMRDTLTLWLHKTLVTLDICNIRHMKQVAHETTTEVKQSCLIIHDFVIR